MKLLAGLWFLIAALLALRGTNLQARLARQRMLEDRDKRIVAAAQAWRPLPRWLERPKSRERRAAAEAALRRDPALWARYQGLRDELTSWNDLETSVALAAPAALIALLVDL